MVCNLLAVVKEIELLDKAKRERAQAKRLAAVKAAAAEEEMIIVKPKIKRNNRGWGKAVQLNSFVRRAPVKSNVLLIVRIISGEFMTAAYWEDAINCL